MENTEIPTLIEEGLIRDWEVTLALFIQANIFVISPQHKVHGKAQGFMRCYVVKCVHL